MPTINYTTDVETKELPIPQNNHMLSITDHYFTQENLN